MSFSVLTLLVRTGRQMVLLGAPQVEGKVDSLDGNGGAPAFPWLVALFTRVTCRQLQKFSPEKPPILYH